MQVGHSLNKLIHRCYTTASCYHSYVLDVAAVHPLGLGVPDLKLRVTVIDNVTTDASDSHSCALLHSIDKLSKEASSRVLEIP